MGLNEFLTIAPAVIKELATEFVRRGDECLKADDKSQLTACLLLALRSSSLLCGMGLLLKPATRDSWDVLSRSLLESTDLLMHFRFDDEGARKKIGYWFAGKDDSAWKADLNKCEDFIRRLGEGESQLGRRWSMLTALSHPTVYAAGNSAKIAAGWVTGLSKTESFAHTMEPKIADYLTSISKLIVVTTFDLPGWVPLGLDLNRIPIAERFQKDASPIVGPILSRYESETLPEGSYRSGKGNPGKKDKFRNDSPD
jgi:hypothetical protein